MQKLENYEQETEKNIIYMAINNIRKIKITLKCPIPGSKQMGGKKYTKAREAEKLRKNDPDAKLVKKENPKGAQTGGRRALYRRGV